jgi:hypothetical protein
VFGAGDGDAQLGNDSQSASQLSAAGTPPLSQSWNAG